MQNPVKNSNEDGDTYLYGDIDNVVNISRKRYVFRCQGDGSCYCSTKQTDVQIQGPSVDFHQLVFLQ